MRHRPSRHPDPLARERGAWRKRWAGLLPVALLFPNRYSLGNSNLGFQLVYDLVNRLPGLVCERFFLGENTPSLSLESSRPLRDFPILLCSLSFEQDFANLIAMLRAGGIEPLAEERNPGHAPSAAGRPFILGGGVATMINPEPLAPFIDCFLIGEAEPVLGQLMEFLASEAGRTPMRELLFELATAWPGCYVPRLYDMQYQPDGTLAAIEPQPGIPKRVRRLLLDQPPKAGHSRLLSPEMEFSDLFLAELGRGCSRGCRFCAAGFVYRPPRLWSVESILAALAERPGDTKRVGLLGMEMARNEDLVRIADLLLSEGCALSFSSLRADAISEELCRLLAASNLKSAAIAPDGGSERLRRVINKGISEADVLQAAEALTQAGLTHLKLYFMIGLPTETEEDLEELLGLVDKVRQVLLAVGRGRGRLSNITLSVNSFVPKAWTPFQFHAMAGLGALKKKIQFLKRGVAGLPNTRLMVDSPGNAFLQAVLARGDRRVGLALLRLAENAAGWRQAMREAGVEPEHYAMRQRGREEVLPWEVVDHGISRDYLWAEYGKALTGRATPACEPLICRRCGVCHD
ncbi:MAG: radical SAM protein [Thermodesulfobacteriota bacterium]